LIRGEKTTKVSHLDETTHLYYSIYCCNAEAAKTNRQL
jgi:hypothetical protein